MVTGPVVIRMAEHEKAFSNRRDMGRSAWFSQTQPLLSQTSQVDFGAAPGRARRAPASHRPSPPRRRTTFIHHRKRAGKPPQIDRPQGGARPIALDAALLACKLNTLPKGGSVSRRRRRSCAVFGCCCISPSRYQALFIPADQMPGPTWGVPFNCLCILTQRSFCGEGQ